MIYLKKFDSHASYDTEINGGGVDLNLPNVSYCKDVKDVHYTPYNLVRFYVGEITPPQTVKIYTDNTNHEDVTVSEGNKWYTYVLPKDKGLFRIEGGSVKNVNVKANININNGYQIIPLSTVEASFKGSNASNVTSMSQMFKWCSKLTSLDLSNFNTSNITDMYGMFQYCSGLASLNLRNFNTSNVTNMESMFEGCSNLTSLDLSNFNTSNVTNIIDMFYDCNSLTSLDLRNFNTSNVTNMSNAFFNCSGLTFLDLSGWDMSSVAYYNNMFRGCTSLTSIRMKGCNQTTINKIKEVMPSSASISTV